MMHRLRVLYTCGVWLLVLAWGSWDVVAAAEPEAQFLTGEVWQTMLPDAKVAYILGIGNLVDFEYATAETPPQARDSFLPWLVKGLSGKSVNEVIGKVDTYYKEHPDQLKHPVVEAIVRTLVLPTLLMAQPGWHER